MNRRELLQLFGASGVVGAIGGTAALERVFEPFRAMPPADSGYIIAKGQSPYALTLQWGMSDAEGLATYPLAFKQVFNITQTPAGYFEKMGLAATRMRPGRHWIAWGFT